MRALVLAAALVAASCSTPTPGAPGAPHEPGVGLAAVPPASCFTVEDHKEAAAEPGVHYMALEAGPAADAFTDWIGTKIGRRPDNALAWLILWRDGRSEAVAVYFDGAGCRAGRVNGPVGEIVPAARGKSAASSAAGGTPA